MSSTPAYLHPYEAAIEALGPRFVSLLWRTRPMQEARFAAMEAMVGFGGRSVADLGSGLADLLLWADREGVRPERYVGVEALRPFVEASRAALAERTAGGPAEIVEADFVADGGLFARLVGERGVDTLVFSGSLNTMDQQTAAGVLDRAWAAVAEAERSALVFNFLSDAGPMSASDRAAPAHRFDTLGMLRWALERTSLVLFRHDYLDGQDATITMLGRRGRDSAYVPPF